MSDATTPSADLVTAHRELAAVLLDEFKDPARAVSAKRACEMVALAMAVAVMQGREDHARFKSLEQRVDALDATNTALQKSLDEFSQRPARLSYRGAWRANQVYHPHEGATFGGVLWVATATTSTRPGDVNSGWQLAEKTAPHNGTDRS